MPQLAVQPEPIVQPILYTLPLLDDLGGIEDPLSKSIVDELYQTENLENRSPIRVRYNSGSATIIANNGQVLMTTPVVADTSSSCPVQQGQADVMSSLNAASKASTNCVNNILKVIN